MGLVMTLCSKSGAPKFKDVDRRIREDYAEDTPEG